MTHSVYIKKIVYNSGASIDCNQGDTIVFVGPNNSGKTATLKGVFEKLRDDNFKHAIVQHVEFQTLGLAKDLSQYLSNIYYLDENNDHFYFPGNKNLPANNAASIWNRSTSIGYLRNAFFCMISIDARLTEANPQQSLGSFRTPPQCPMHYLLIDDKKFEKLKTYIREGFGKDLEMSRIGVQVSLHFGMLPEKMDGEVSCSSTYIKKIHKEMSPLEEQGGGIRAYTGILLHLVTNPVSSVFIDEPEAFLHPPQAKKIGQIILRERPENTQTVIATHSTDVLKGLLDNESQKIRIIRLTREGNDTVVSELDPGKLQRLRKDPVLRHTSVLDGVFYDQVIICEAEADCKFYKALSATDQNSISHEILFLSSAGKQRIHKLIEPLRSLRVKSKVIVDFDVLQNEKELKLLATSCGVKWDEVKDDYLIIKNTIKKRGEVYSSTEAFSKINEYASNYSDDYITNDAKSEINIFLNGAMSPEKNSWKKAKKEGYHFFEKDNNALTAWERLNELFQSHGIFIVPVGEMESFFPDGKLKGQPWVDNMLENSLRFKTDTNITSLQKNDDPLQEAVNFVRKVVNHELIIM